MKHRMHIIVLCTGMMLAIPGFAQVFEQCSNPPTVERAANPGDYAAVIASAQPGERINLAAGTYASGLTLHNLNGQSDACIVIEGPSVGPPAVFTSNACCNTVSVSNTSYLVVRNLEIQGNGEFVDAVKLEGTADWAHHITLENLYIHGFDVDQQAVGISTKAPAWRWIIRNNVIDGAGTGLYLGNSDGSAPFVGGLIEYNLIRRTLGYNLQIKHQNSRNTALADGSMPGTAQTVMRYNVFSKAENAATGGDARPNVLVGQFPATGDGSEDDYVLYGNLFYENASGTEGLFQGTGNVAAYANLLVNTFGDGFRIQPHNGGDPRRVRAYFNTLMTAGTGIFVSSTGVAGFEQQVRGNAIFADGSAIGGSGAEAMQNHTDTRAAANSVLTNPDGHLSGGDQLDLFPSNSTLHQPGDSVDSSDLSGYPDAGVDFNGSDMDGSWRGAYAGSVANPGWMLALARQSLRDTVLFRDGFELVTVDPLASLSDDFSAAGTMGQWQRIYVTENWGFDQMEDMDIASTRPGWLTMIPYTSSWYQDYRGILMYKAIDGDFVVSSRVQPRARGGVGAPGSSSGNPAAEYSLSGIMVRQPREVTTPDSSWWQPGGENYVFLSMGSASTAGTYQFEVKTTTDSNSILQIDAATSGEARLRIARLGAHVIVLLRNPGENWQVHRRYLRADFDQTLQVGLTVYTDWEIASTYAPADHNTTLITHASGNPGNPADPDLQAQFDYVHFARPDIPPGLQGADFSNPVAVSDAQLLQFLGYP